MIKPKPSAEKSAYNEVLAPIRESIFTHPRSIDEISLEGVVIHGAPGYPNGMVYGVDETNIYIRGFDADNDRVIINAHNLNEYIELLQCSGKKNLVFLNDLIIDSWGGEMDFKGISICTAGCNNEIDAGRTIKGLHMVDVCQRCTKKYDGEPHRCPFPDVMWRKDEIQVDCRGVCDWGGKNLAIIWGDIDGDPFDYDDSHFEDCIIEAPQIRGTFPYYKRCKVKCDLAHFSNNIIKKRDITSESGRVIVADDSGIFNLCTKKSLSLKILWYFAIVACVITFAFNVMGLVLNWNRWGITHKVVICAMYFCQLSLLCCIFNPHLKHLLFKRRVA